MTEKTKEKYGQYMTPERIVDFMVSLIGKEKQCKILEPSSGEGIFLEQLSACGYKNITAYEIDKNIIKDKEKVINESFVSASVKNDYDVVIGNPPYIRWKNLESELKDELLENNLFKQYLNALNDYSAFFILKGITALKEGGELIFITPDYWMNTTHSLNLRNFILENGYISDLYLFKEAKIFKKVTVSLMIFKFIKDKTKRPDINVCKYNQQKEVSEEIISSLINKTPNSDIECFSIPQFNKNQEWILAPDEEISNLQKYEQACMIPDKTAPLLNMKKMAVLEDYCEIGNGMVSGLDKAFQLKDDICLNEFEKERVIEVVKAKDLEPYRCKNITGYIFAEDIEKEAELKSKAPSIYANLQPYKEKLAKRYSYNRDLKYWEWAFLRNYSLFRDNRAKIFVPCKERISNKDYHRFAPVYGDVFPTQDVTAILPKEDTKESIEYICANLNSRAVFNWIKHKGIIKGNIVEFSRSPLAKIPFRHIDFDKPKEKELHDKITDLVKTYLCSENVECISEIEVLFSELLTV